MEANIFLTSLTWIVIRGLSGVGQIDQLSFLGFTVHAILTVLFHRGVQTDLEQNHTSLLDIS